jgi:hypothetical protein
VSEDALGKMDDGVAYGTDRHFDLLALLVAGEPWKLEKRSARQQKFGKSVMFVTEYPSTMGRGGRTQRRREGGESDFSASFAPLRLCVLPLLPSLDFEET